MPADKDVDLIMCFENSFFPSSAEEVFSFEQLTKFRCQECPVCAVCPGNEVIGIKQFYWALEEKEPPWKRERYPNAPAVRTSRKMFRCPEFDKNMACLGGTDMDGVVNHIANCKEGHQGVACAECEAGFAISDTKCESCGNEKIGEKIGAIIFSVCIVAVIGYAALKWLTPEIAVKLKILVAMGQVPPS
jgi:hypothetical protein